MKKYFLILWVCISSITCYGQMQGLARIDSLQNELLKSGEDSFRVNVLNILSDEYCSINYNKGIQYGELALVLAKKIGWKKGIATANSSLGINYIYKSDYKKSKECFLEALQINSRIGDKKGEAMNTGNLGLLFINQGDYSNALEYHMKAVKMYEEIGDTKGVATNTVDIGDIYRKQSNYPKALEYSFKALKLFEETGYSKGVLSVAIEICQIYRELGEYDKAMQWNFSVLNIAEKIRNKYETAIIELNIGNVYSDAGNYPKALEYYFKSLEIGEEIQNKNCISKNTADIGYVYRRQKNYSKALEYYFKALKIREDIGNENGVGLTLGYIGECILSEINDTSGASFTAGKVIGKNTSVNSLMLKRCIEYLERGLAIGKKSSAPAVMQICYENLVKAYKMEENFKKSMKCYENYIVIKDSVFSKEIDRKILKAGMEGEYQRKRFNDSLVMINSQRDSEMELQKQRSYTYVGQAGILILAFFSVFIIKERRRSEKARKKSGILVRQKQELLSQKDMLMKEIHHRVKNNLQVISTLLDLQMINMTDEHAKDAITESAARLKAISLIHQQLYQEAHITSIECFQFTTDLHQQINSVFNKPGQQIILHNNIPQVALDIDTAVPLGLIINELMTNSYKYAFNAGSGSINCGINKEEEVYKMTYTDSGPGLAPGLDVKKLKSLGMMMMKNLGKQLGGSFSYIAETKTFILTFRDNETMKKIA